MATPLFPRQYDGSPRIEQEITPCPLVTYPFSENPVADVFSRLLSRRYLVAPYSFSPRIAARTSWSNLLLQSEALDNAAWTKTNVTIVANAATAPDGNLSMDAVNETVTNAAHQITQASVVVATPYVLSGFAAANGRNFLRMAFTDSAAAVFSAFFDISSGRVFSVAGAGATATIARAPDGRFRCQLLFTPSAGAGTVVCGISSDGVTTAYVGDVAKGILLWGVELKAGTRVGPYVSTTSASRTILAPDDDTQATTQPDPFAFLVGETDPVVRHSQGQTFGRTFARVPRQQIVPDSLFVAKPDIPGTFPQVFGGLLVVRPISTVASYDGYAIQAVVGDSGAPGGLPTGGTFPLTFGANTTAATAYNATAVVVQTNLNALASITNYGGVTVTGSNTAGYTVTFTYATISASVGGLTSPGGGTAQVVVTPQNNGLIQNVVITATHPNPGFSVTPSFTPSGANPSLFNSGSAVPFGSVADAANLTWSLGNGYSNTPATGSTYTITVFGQTTGALNYNDNAATVQAALNALGNVATNGGYTVVGPFTNFISGSPSVPVMGAQIAAPSFNGGMLTLTVLGQTTGAFAYNASLATIEAAINALSNVTACGGAIVSGAGFTGDKISLTITFANIPTISGSAAALTPAGTSITITPSNSQGYIQVVSFGASTANTRLLTVNNHGLVAGDTLFFKDANGNYYTAVTSGVTFPSANTVQLVASVGTPYSVAAALTEVGKRTLVGYSPTSKETRVKYVTDFYLPGVTPGITTMDDIPLPTYQGDPSSLLTAIFAGTTSINYQVGGLKPWRGPILQRTTTTLDASAI